MNDAHARAGISATRAAPTAAQREQRKQDLLMASQMLRLQATVALDDLGDRVDGAARRLQAIRAFFSSPLGLGAIGLVGVLLARAKAKRKRPFSVARLARWAWLGWRLWRCAPGRSGSPPPT